MTQRARRNGLPLASAIAAGLALAAVSARADSAGRQAAHGEVAPYDVYVTSPGDIAESVTTVRRIDDAAIEEKSARTLDEVLQREPSIVVRRAGEGSPRIDLRGLRTRQVLLLVDGIPFYSTEDGNFDPSLIPSQVIESVDVTYSNSSVLYGDGPIAGVLQVRTRSGENGVQARARADVRDGGQYLGELRIGGAGGGYESFVAGSYFSAHGWEMSDDFGATPVENGGLRDNSDRDQGNAFVKLGYAPGENSRVDMLFDYRHADYGVPPNVYDRTIEPDFGQNPRFERVKEVEGYSGQLSGQLRLGERFDLRSWGFVGSQREDRARYDDAGFDSMLQAGSYRVDGTTLVSGGALHGRTDLGRYGALRLAANGRYERFDSDGHIRERGGGGMPGALAEIDESNDLGAWSLGMEYEIHPVESAGIVLGYGHAFFDADQGAGDDGSLFLGGAYYDFPTATRLRASAAHKLRFASIRQLYDVDGGNPGLDSERCWCFEVGIEQQLPYASRIAVTGYWLELRDFIERNEVTRVFENRQELRNRGFEVTAESRPIAPLFLRVAYTYLDARDVSDGSPFDRLDNRPRHKIDGVVVYALPWGTSFRVGWTWAEDILIYSRSEPVTTRKLEQFFLLDLKLEQGLWEDRVRVYAGVDNVLDEEWSYNFGYPQPGRTVYGGLELRF